MAGGVSGAASGFILGLVLGLLAQQFGYLNFTGNLVSALLYLFLIAILLGVIGGIGGWALKSRAIRRAKAMSAPAPAAADTTEAAPKDAAPPQTPPSGS